MASPELDGGTGTRVPAVNTDPHRSRSSDASRGARAAPERNLKEFRRLLATSS
jgi:hypothetical protein